MFDFLSEINKECYKRYLTLELNLEAGSNSFFDSYRALCESLTKYYLSESEIVFAERDSFAELTSRADVCDYLYGKGIKEETIEKIRDYILKINKHVHRREKELLLDIVSKYLDVLYDFVAPYAHTKGIKTKRPTLDEMSVIYRAHEREELYRERENSRIENKLDELLNRNATPERDPKPDPPLPTLSFKEFIQNTDQVFHYSPRKNSSFRLEKWCLVGLNVLLVSLIYLISFTFIFENDFYASLLTLPWMIMLIVIIAQSVRMSKSIKGVSFREKTICDTSYYTYYKRTIPKFRYFISCIVGIGALLINSFGENGFLKYSVISVIYSILSITVLLINWLVCRNYSILRCTSKTYADEEGKPLSFDIIHKKPIKFPYTPKRFL